MFSATNDISQFVVRAWQEGDTQVLMRRHEADPSPLTERMVAMFQDPDVYACIAWAGDANVGMPLGEAFYRVHSEGVTVIHVRVGCEAKEQKLPIWPCMWSAIRNSVDGLVTMNIEGETT
jgi:hypothetical protein